MTIPTVLVAGIGGRYSDKCRYSRGRYRTLYLPKVGIGGPISISQVGIVKNNYTDRVVGIAYTYISGRYRGHIPDFAGTSAPSNFAYEMSPSTKMP